MGSGSSSGGGETGRTGLPPFQNKAVRRAIGQGQGVYNQGMPQVQALSSPYGPVAQTGAMANQLAQNTLQGNYLSPQSNPYLQAYANAADQGLVQNYMNATAPSTAAAFLHAGSFGDSSAYNQAVSNNEYQLANAIGNTNANIYEPAYQAERQIQANTINQTPIAQQVQYTAPEAPLNYQNRYNQGLMNLLRPYGYSETQQVYPSDEFTASQGIGTGLGAAGLGHYIGLY